jgi:hypothetical protein
MLLYFDLDVYFLLMLDNRAFFKIILNTKVGPAQAGPTKVVLCIYHEPKAGQELRVEPIKIEPCCYWNPVMICPVISPNCWQDIKFIKKQLYDSSLLDLSA